MRIRKLLEIAACGLTPAHKILYALRRGRGRYRLKGGGYIELRRDTTDGKVFEEIFLTQIYAPFAELSRGGGEPVALIDLGANTGLTSVYLSRALRPVRIVAVEPDPANFRMLLRNVDLAGIADRVIAVQAFAGAERGYAQLEDSGNGAWGMRMGSPAAGGVPVLPVSDIAALARTSRIVMKCDIEGAERHLFQRLRDWEHLVSFLMLELHTEFFPEEAFRSCIEASGYHWKIYGSVAPGSVLAVLALERGAAKERSTSHAAPNRSLH